MIVDGDDQFIKNIGCPFHQVEVTEMDRIEGAGVNSA
jgi:hypothetical protein